MNLKRIQQAVLTITRSAFFWGALVTLVFSYTGHRFYALRNMNENDRPKSWLFEFVEALDLKLTDFKFRIRDQIQSDAPVALIAIDDRSIEQVGRWPWSREKMAHIIDQLFQHGATGVGLDIIFAEKQEAPQLNLLKEIQNTGASRLPVDLQKKLVLELSQATPDDALAKVIEKHKEHLVLGVFNEETSNTYKAYQDYCRNEAFLRANAQQFVKMNTSFIVEDLADEFVDLPFNEVLNPIFELEEKIHRPKLLKNFFRNRAEAELSDRESAQLRYQLDENNMSYCNLWLTGDDPYLANLLENYRKIFSASSSLKDLSIEAAIEKFKRLVLTHPVAQRSRRWTINTAAIQAASSYSASFNADQDSDGTIRKTSMFFRTGNRLGLSFIPSLSLQTYLVSTGHRALVNIDVDKRNPLQKAISSFSIINPNDNDRVTSEVPVDSQARMRINYYGGSHSFPYIPAKDLLSDSDQLQVWRKSQDSSSGKWLIQEHWEKKADFIKGKAFLIGATAVGIYDLRVSPFEKNFPGPETHIHSMANLFDGSFLKSPTDEPFKMVAFLTIFGLVFSMFVAQAGALMGFSGSLLSLLALSYFDMILFRKGLVVTSLLAYLEVLLLFALLTFYKYLTEERKKKYLRSTFSKYVSPAIVDEILKDPENIELGGRKQRLTIFFSDVRGFTTISEKLDPQVLSQVLNEYLTPMTQIVFQNKGTLDKYIGDAVMSFFGAPVFFSDHAKYCCRCALQSVAKLAEIRQSFAARGMPDIDIGIGINTAEVSVGNMGSDIVRNYTVMGDGVNLASRLEGITKEYGVRIVISQSTHDSLNSAFVTRELDWVRVKGKLEPVKIFELLSEGPLPADQNPWLESYQKAYSLYRDQRFEDSLSEFSKCQELRPNDNVAALFIERCQEFKRNPPPSDWDGVFVMKTK